MSFYFASWANSVKGSKKTYTWRKVCLFLRWFAFDVNVQRPNKKKHIFKLTQHGRTEN